MLVHNPRAVRTAYPDSLKPILNRAAAAQSRRWLAGWPLVRAGATPLWELPGLAARLGLGQVAVKDEAERSALGSFKALGAPVALLRLVMRQRDAALDAERLFRGDYRDQLAGLTVISATDGNHGRALAAAAQSIGCRCVIVLHAEVSVEREQAIAAYGAEIVRVAGKYDAAVAEAARLAAAHGWQVVSDTSYLGYTDVPRDVMQGYAIIAAEVLEQRATHSEQPAFTHVFVQGGVGGLAAGVASYLWEHDGAQRPRIVVVEPEQADCLYQSAIQGRPAQATGAVDSIMAGLACGEASPLAWQFLEAAADDFLLIRDDEAVAAMRLLAQGEAGDVPLVSGESGAAGLAGLCRLCADPQLAREVGLDATARVLLINTEGATAPAAYGALVGQSEAVVRDRQVAWLTARMAGAANTAGSASSGT